MCFKIKQTWENPMMMLTKKIFCTPLDSQHIPREQLAYTGKCGNVCVFVMFVVTKLCCSCKCVYISRIMYSK